jgi:cell division protein FtsI (penicillin-binding protein 3)
VFGGEARIGLGGHAAVVVLDEPNAVPAGQHQGGQVAAPVFARVMGGALRLLAVAPDAPVFGPEEMPSSTMPDTLRTAALR